MGKGSFLIAGYNTASEKEKAKYNEKIMSYCRIRFSCYNLWLVFFVYAKRYRTIYNDRNFYCWNGDYFYWQ